MLLCVFLTADLPGRVCSAAAVWKHSVYDIEYAAEVRPCGGAVAAATATADGRARGKAEEEGGNAVVIIIIGMCCGF